MIEKILDNYYTKKLLIEFQYEFIMRGLDYEFEDTLGYILVKCKPMKYKDEYYTILFKFKKENSLRFYCNLENSIRKLKKIIKQYQENIKY